MTRERRHKSLEAGGEGTPKHAVHPRLVRDGRRRNRRRCKDGDRMLISAVQPPGYFHLYGQIRIIMLTHSQSTRDCVPVNNRIRRSSANLIKEETLPARVRALFYNDSRIFFRFVFAK